MSELLPLIPRTKGYDILRKQVIDKSLCTYCGSCTFCSNINLLDVPERKDECKMCQSNDILNCSGTCYSVCPMAEADISELESMFLEGILDKDLGVVRELTALKTKVTGQDGGVVTSLLLAGMEKGIFDAAVVAKRENGFRAVPVIAGSAEDIMSARGSKYLAVPMVSKLCEAVNEKCKKKVAVVGTPCEVIGIRKVQKMLLSQIPDLDVTVIGLFCMENFWYDKLREKISSLGTDLDKADKASISRGKFIVSVGGAAKECKVAELHDAVRTNCSYCTDFTSKLADISVGSVGSPDGYSTVIVRSKRGGELLKLLKDVEKTNANKDEIVRLTSFKKEKALSREA